MLKPNLTRFAPTAAKFSAKCLTTKILFFALGQKYFIANQGGRRVAKIGLPSYSSLQQIKEVKIDCLRMYGLALTTTEVE